MRAAVSAKTADMIWWLVGLAVYFIGLVLVAAATIGERSHHGRSAVVVLLWPVTLPLLLLIMLGRSIGLLRK
jgi:hypothetical protein